ncbi:MAG: hypothetical protein AAF390_18485 [Pseudomonadota bacterium]
MTHRRPTRRRSHARGIALAEALVALAIAAMTLLLLTSASWGLRHANDRRDAAQATDAADWLAARRVIHGWSAGLTAPRSDRAGSRVLGTASTARLVLSSVDAGLPTEAVAELRVIETDDRFVLIAARYAGDRDVRTASGDARGTELLSTVEPLRLAYLYPGGDGRARPTWRYETDAADLPLAIALEVGGERRIVAPVLPERSAACVAAVGDGGMEEPRCELR